MIVKNLLSQHSYIGVALVTKILADACLYFINSAVVIVNYMQIYLVRHKNHKKVDHSFTTKIVLRLEFNNLFRNYYFMNIGPFCMHFILKSHLFWLRPRDLSNVAFDIPTRKGKEGYQLWYVNVKKNMHVISYLKIPSFCLVIFMTLHYFFSYFHTEVYNIFVYQKSLIWTFHASFLTTQ